MSQMRNVACALILLFIATTASAALSPQYTEWRNGPVQWIMTSAEKSAWKKVTTDEAAVAYIDLFWARRDPTEGTPQNEARDEHLSRVKTADMRYSEPRVKGSMSDRGRTLVVLGPAPNQDAMMGRIAAGGASVAGGARESAPSGSRGNADAPSGNGSDPSHGRQLGERDVWIWEHEQAVEKFDLPRVEVVFVTDPISKHTIRDVFRRDFGAAERTALRRQIVHDYQELPKWAAYGGLTPMTTMALHERPSVTPGPAAHQQHQTAVPVDAAPDVAMAPRGATKLVLSKDVFAVDPETNNDPFSRIQSTAVFTPTDELGWAARYCAQSTEAPAVPFKLRITGNAAGKKVNRASAPDDMVPDRIKGEPGCSLMRGSIPMEGMAAGQYTLHLVIEDPLVKGDSYTLVSDFTVE